jgi:hypothetical protein
LLQPDVSGRRRLLYSARPLLQGSGLVTVDKRDSEPGPAVRIGFSWLGAVGTIALHWGINDGLWEPTLPSALTVALM